MKVFLRIFAAFCIIGFTSGCGEIKDALDIVFEITYHHVFTLKGNTETPSYNINLADNGDFMRYKRKLRSIRIDYIRYSITSNAGAEGTGYLYAGSYGSAFSSATKVARTNGLAAGQTHGETDVEWINMPFLENLLDDEKLSLWAAGGSPGVDMIVPIVIKIRITANPLE